MPAIVTSNHWHAIYEILPDGRVKANITDNNGRQYAYGQIFDSLDELKAFLNSK